MGGLTMYIILGVLVSIVVIFLVITTILDRKKAKKLKIKQKELMIESKKAIPEIVKKISLIINTNDEKLEKFIPSIGKIKMVDINQSAKKDLLAIKNLTKFKLLKTNEILFEKFTNHIINLINSKSNNWHKNNQVDINFFLNYQEFEKKMFAEEQAEIKKNLEESKSSKKKINWLFSKFKKKVKKNE